MSLIVCAGTSYYWVVRLVGATEEQTKLLFLIIESRRSDIYREKGLVTAGITA